MIDARKLAAEALGTAFLLAVIVGSGIMGEQLADGNTAIALLANSTATGAGLVVLILVFGPISGAHFNPAVTLVAALRRELSTGCALAFVGAQLVGALAGVAAAHLMFDLPLYSPSTHDRTGLGQWWSEFVATFGLILMILSCVRYRPAVAPFAVAAYIASAYWFTASTSFANPAVTLARATTNTFSGIYPGDVLGFMAAQVVAAIVACLFFDWLSKGEVKQRSTEAAAADTSPVGQDSTSGLRARHRGELPRCHHQWNGSMVESRCRRSRGPQ